MVNMKMSKEEAEEYSSGSAISGEQPQYPYGLRINLDDDAMEKLGMAALPKIGQTMIIHARVEVCSVSEYETMGQEKEQSVSLQITDMELAADKQGVDASKFYGG